MIDNDFKDLKTLNMDLFIGKGSNLQNDVKTIVIGDGIQWIGNGQFGLSKDENNSLMDKDNRLMNLESVVLPSSLVGVGERAFACCKKLEEVFIEDAKDTKESSSCLRVIDKCAFFDSGLKKIEFPKSIKCICERAFSNCNDLVSVIFKGTEDNISSIECIDNNAFSNCGLREIEIPNSVKIIGVEAFRGCQGLLAVEIKGEKVSPSSLRLIGRSAFDNCRKMYFLKLPYSRRQNLAGSVVGEFAFCNCYSLTQVEIPSTFTKVARGAFYKCPSLAKAIVDKKRTFIDKGAFDSACNIMQAD